MHVSVCICTRNRGAHIMATLRSIAASHHDDYDVAVVDQSLGDETEDAVRVAIAGAPYRTTYVRSGTAGLSAARNVAIGATTGPVVAFTDDDCEVTPSWVGSIADYFATLPYVGLVSGVVRATPFDPSQGLTPEFFIRTRREVTRPWRHWNYFGMGANISFRRTMLEDVGPFDEVLGPGAPLHMGDDSDMLYRGVRTGHILLQAPDVEVLHSGFRTWQQAQGLVTRYALSAGAAYSKHIRLGDTLMARPLVGECVGYLSWSRLLRRQPRSGAARVLAFVRGLRESVRYDIDRRWRVYLSRPDAVRGEAVVRRWSR